ncbi:hypothetical protein L486_04783 [Kwoniella mangroviensis CBS 10435]|uniref:Uncharacterized protein n=1 Tax=Kwoniella mangroviensis CBS 10435 TaxID=1331196 RepID=A0A1B9IP69_9TREE|nr:hypothetical protein L486_04783 [Kwoniella mangroviensis CBS 10435]OCF76118.1 hypothetical protein I204_03417 [Kwoniella mangroviensis CBS 8886]
MDEITPLLSPVTPDDTNDFVSEACEIILVEGSETNENVRSTAIDEYHEMIRRTAEDEDQNKLAFASLPFDTNSKLNGITDEPELDKPKLVDTMITRLLKSRDHQLPPLPENLEHLILSEAEGLQGLRRYAEGIKACYTEECEEAGELKHEYALGE